MGIAESSVRSLLNPDSESRMKIAANTADFLKKQVDEVTDYFEARKWIEDHTKGIEDLISTASEEDQSCSRRLAVILLTVRE